MQLRDAAATLGVHYQTAYGWVRQGTLPARKTPRGYEVAESDVRGLLASRAAGTRPPQEVRVTDWPAQALRMYVALVTGDEVRARRKFTRLTAGASLTMVCDQVIAPALRRVGAGWSVGEVTVAVEHRASAISERLIAGQVRQSQGRPRGVAVTATPPGERHALPALMATACLREDHWQVHHLAADLPAGDLIALAADTAADLIVLSATTASGVRTASKEAGEIREHLPHVRVLVGHPGDTLELLRELARAARSLGEA
jgi:MerR family transcriptional regulator, light-induced transcriptional regulator